jgi:hypothetical protein
MSAIKKVLLIGFMLVIPAVYGKLPVLMRMTFSSSMVS